AVARADHVGQADTQTPAKCAASLSLPLVSGGGLSCPTSRDLCALHQLGVPGEEGADRAEPEPGRDQRVGLDAKSGIDLEETFPERRCGFDWVQQAWVAIFILDREEQVFRDPLRRLAVQFADARHKVAPIGVGVHARHSGASPKLRAGISAILLQTLMAS